MRPIAIAIALAAGVVSAAPAETLRFNQITPSNHFYHQRVLVPWAQDVEKATAGRVKVEFTGASLGPMPRQFDLALTGVADIATGNQAPIPGRFPMTLMIELPFLGDSAEAISVALWRVHEKHLIRADEYKGTKLLTLFASGPAQLFTAKGPLTSLDQLKGTKLRTSGITTDKMAKTFGAVTVSTPVSEMYDVISKGVVDGTMTTHTAVQGWKVDKFLRYEGRVPGGLYFGPFFIVMNEDKWKAIAPVDQAAIMALSGEKLASRAGRVFEEEDKRGMATRAQNDTVVTKFEGALLDDLKKRFAFLEDDWIVAATAKGIDGAAALAMLRAEAAAYQPSK
jgi:TRAP-type C4-dicarboxylate transport system substrate-binding protein